MQLSDLKYTEKQIIISARILLAVLTPALAFSIFRALTEDGAYGIIGLQSALWLLLVATCLERVPLGLKGRISALVGIFLIVALGSMIRNQSFFAAMPSALITGLYLSIVAGPAFRYVVPVITLAVFAVSAWLLNYVTAVAGLSHIMAYGGVLTAVIYLYSSMQQRARKQAQEARDANDKLEMMTADGDIGLFELDLENEVVSGNSVWRARFGLDDASESVSFAEIMDALSPDSRKASYDRLAEMQAAPVGYQHSCTIEQRFADGALHTVRINERKVERNGRHYMVGAAVDVTAEYESSRKAANLEEQIDLVSRAGGVGFIEFFPDTRTFKCNEEVSQRLGIDHTVEQQPIDLFYAHQTEETRQAFLKYRDQLHLSNTAELQTFVHAFYHANGDLHHYRVSRVKRELDGRVSFLGLSLDITDEVNAQLNVEASAKKLLAEQERQKQMYAVIGHELRTPAASLQMMLDDLEEGESLDSALVGSNIEHLLGVIDTLRAVAQPERMAQAAFKEVVMDELLTDQVANLSGLAERSGVKLTSELSNLKSEPVYVQSQLLRQVTANLIKNAIIHSGGDSVHLSANGELKGDHTKALTIRISDNGKGIPESEVEKLFDAYERGDSNAEGTGLGLFVCREIINMMGGEIHYETSGQGGAEFVIDLVVNLSDKGNKSSELLENLLEGKRVLIAEDNSVIQMLTAKMLKKQGATVVINSNGQQALDAYADGGFDLVMSDIFMPELDGYGLVKGLRERGYTGPIVGLTAATIGAETDLMLEAGADIVISKPIEVEKLQTFLMEYHRQSAS
jgi:signal transduction histidine kinase/ActR/RegA family two-component response regulator